MPLNIEQLENHITRGFITQLGGRNIRSAPSVRDQNTQSSGSSQATNMELAIKQYTHETYHYWVANQDGFRPSCECTKVHEQRHSQLEDPAVHRPSNGCQYRGASHRSDLRSVAIMAYPNEKMTSWPAGDAVERERHTRSNRVCISW